MGINQSFPTLESLIEYYQKHPLEGRNPLGTRLTHDHVAQLTANNTYRVLFEYKNGKNEHLKLEKGYTIGHVEKTSENLWYGMCLETEEFGKFPSKYVEPFERSTIADKILKQESISIESLIISQDPVQPLAVFLEYNKSSKDKSLTLASEEDICRIIFADNQRKSEFLGSCKAFTGEAETDEVLEDEYETKQYQQVAQEEIKRQTVKKVRINPMLSDLVVYYRTAPIGNTQQDQPYAE